MIVAGKRKESESPENDQPSKVFKLERDVTTEDPIGIDEKSPPQAQSTGTLRSEEVAVSESGIKQASYAGVNENLLPINVKEWTDQHFQELRNKFKIISVEDNADLNSVLSEFSSVEIAEHYLVYITALQHSFESLQICPLNPTPDEHSIENIDILSQTVLDEILERLRAAKATLSSNPCTRFSAAVSFLNDLKILSKVTLANVGAAHLKMLFHSLMQSTGLHVRSGCDYTSQEEVLGQSFTASPDMRIYAENHLEFREPRILATVKVNQADPTKEMENLLNRDSVAQAVGQLLLDFRHSHHPDVLLKFVVYGTKVWIICLRRNKKDMSEGDKCRIMMDREFRYESFVNSEKELFVSKPLDYLRKEDRAKLYEVFAKFASAAGFTTQSQPDLPPGRQRLFTKSK